MMLSCSQHSYIAESLGNPDMPYPHEMPNIPMQDLDIMVDSKATIDMSGEVNPFGALNIIKNNSSYQSFTPEKLNNIKAELQLEGRCYGCVFHCHHEPKIVIFSFLCHHPETFRLPWHKP